MSTQPPCRVIGTRPPRADATDKVTGRALFGPDISLPGTLYGQVLRSPHAHARIRAIDTMRAEALPGVWAVVTARDLPPALAVDEATGIPKVVRDNPLAGAKVLYQGHAVAGVAASSREIAEEALKLIVVDYEVLPPVMDVLAAMRPDAPRLHEGLRTRSFGPDSGQPGNIASHSQSILGDPAAGFAQADVVVERTFSTCTVHQGYIEPHACTAVWGADGQLTVWVTTQGAFAIRSQLAEALRLPLARVRVYPTEVGGGFGGKFPVYLEPVAALLARKSGRTVKMVMSRAEVFLGTGPGCGGVMRVKMGATCQGRLTAAQAEVYYEGGAYPGAPADAIGLGLACYDIPNGQIDAYDVLVNKPKTGAYRAPGGTSACFATEQVIDELACKLGMDPLAFRVQNAAREGMRCVDGSTHQRIGVREVLEAARQHPHYHATLPGKHCGRGLALGYWSNWGAQSSCTLHVNADGTLNLLTGSVDLSGTRTTTAMQVAEALGLEVSQIKCSVGDTDAVGYTEVSGGSRTTFATGLAAIAAARDVLAQMCARAAAVWGVPVESVSYQDATFSTGQETTPKLGFADLAGMLADTGGPVSGKGNVDAQGWGGAFACHIADVQVDPETGKVQVLRYTAIQDVGQAVHPTIVEGQMQGGATQGIGWALYEGYQYDAQGRMLNPNLLDYKLPTALDVPPIATVIVEVPGPGHPYGVRGVGEAPIVPPAAALANAIASATGCRLQELPMTPERILRARGVI